MGYSAPNYTTIDPHTRIVDGYVFARRWNDVGDVAACDEPRLEGDAVVVSAFSNPLKRLYGVAPDALQPLGRVTAVLRLDICRRRLRNRRAAVARRPAQQSRSERPVFTGIT